QTDNMRLRYHNSEVYFAYVGATSGTRQMLIYDIYKKRWRSRDFNVGMTELYSEPGTVSSLLLGSSGGILYETGGTVDPRIVEVLEGPVAASIPVLGVTLTPGSYFVRVSRSNVAVEVAVSNEISGITVDATHAIGVTIPFGPAGTVSWRVYYGTTLGVENQY